MHPVGDVPPNVVGLVGGLVGLPGAAVDQHAQIARLSDSQVLGEAAVGLPTGFCEFPIYLAYPPRCSDLPSTSLPEDAAYLYRSPLVRRVCRLSRVDGDAAFFQTVSGVCGRGGAVSALGGKEMSGTRVGDGLLRKKDILTLQRESEGETDFRTLGLWSLTAIGIGGIIGVGAFVLLGTASANNAGPDVTLSFIVAGIASACAALCYAEFAGMIPISGAPTPMATRCSGNFSLGSSAGTSCWSTRWWSRWWRLVSQVT